MVKFAPILPMRRAIISAVGKKSLDCQCQNQASLLPSQLFPFPSIVLRLLENDAAKGKHARPQNTISLYLGCFPQFGGQPITQKKQQKQWGFHSVSLAMTRRTEEIPKLKKAIIQNFS